MYLELGKTKINYQSQGSREDSIILAEVVDSDMSFEKPVFVRSANELILWFGTEFKDFDYLKELVSSGNTLYLFRPIIDEDIVGGSNYIDYSNYLDDKDEFFINNLPDEGVPGKIYKRVSVEGKGKFKDIPRNYTFDKLIWLDNLGGWIDISELPQNLEMPKTASYNNRDTLRLCYTDSNFSYCYPTFGENLDDSKTIILPEILESIESESFYNSEVVRGTYTLAFKLDYNNARLKSGSYIILPRSSQQVLYYFGEIPTEPGNEYYQEAERFTSIQDLINKLSDSGYRLDDNILYCPECVHITGLCNIEGFNIIPADDINKKILEKLTKSDTRIEFWSRTIGNGGIDGDINVKIEFAEGGDNPYYYKVTIERFDIVEVFFGYTLTTELDNRIDSIINRESKIVYCKMQETYMANWENTKTGRVIRKEIEYNNQANSIGDYFISNLRDPGIPTGNWALKGSTKEINPSYRKGLELLLKYSDTTYIDFLMISNPDVFVVDNKYEDMWKWLLELLINSNSQALVECSESNYSFNYREDRKNYLIYFYGNMQNGIGIFRPGYYTFLKGLLNGIYSFTGNDIIYTSPIERNVMYTSSDLKRDLVLSKANYMIDNGQYYYFPKYFDGDNYITSGLMRFCLGKVQRELEKYKWTYLSLPTTGSIKKVIEGILDRVQSKYSIIRSLLIKEFNIDQRKGELSLKIETKISDLVKNIVDLDITINYNKPI